MEKILLAVDGLNPNPHSLDFACYLARISNSKVTGVFLENLAADKKPVLHVTDAVAYLNWEIDKPNDWYKEKEERLENTISLFQDACEKRSVRYSVHKNGGVPEKEIISESRYADLLVVNAEIFFNKKFEGIPSGFVTEVLKDSECPVVIAPEIFDGIDEIVFAFNGSRSSMFAIKQFTYLFPEMDDKKVTVLEIDDEDRCPIEEKEKFKEWINGHYSSIGYTTLKGDAESELFAYLLNKKNVFIVMGAYGRGNISRMFRHSRSNLVIKAIPHSIFITHP